MGKSFDGDPIHCRIDTHSYHFLAVALDPMYSDLEYWAVVDYCVRNLLAGSLSVGRLVDFAVGMALMQGAGLLKP